MVQEDCKMLANRDLLSLKYAVENVRDLLMQGKARAVAPVLREMKVHINHLERWAEILGESNDKG